MRSKSCAIARPRAHATGRTTRRTFFPTKAGNLALRACNLDRHFGMMPFGAAGGSRKMYQPKVTVKSAAEVKAILGADFPSQVAKIIDHIDSHCRAWIERCPFVVISSMSAAGAMDVSPKGDPPGFVKVLDEHTLAVPDR